MTDYRIHNFNAGPAALPLPVLEEVREHFLNFNNSGMSISEISHRSAGFENVLNDAIERTRRLLKLNDTWRVIFVQGGASLQFAMVPLNFLAGDQSADYVNTGTWSTKAIKEARHLGKNIQVVASSEDRNFSYIPNNIAFSQNARYVHLTSNNTIKGTQWASFPDTGSIPLVSDMSSDFMSRPLDMARFGLIYAGAQKNIGPAGVCMVIVRENLLQNIPSNLPTMLNYTTYTNNNSMYNTPPCVSIYMVQLVLKWLEDTVGGLAKMESLNQQKANLLYSLLDQEEFYRGTAEPGSRSLMNVTFRLPTEELEKRFIKEAAEHGLGGLKGHRSVGGCRASIYNATSLNSIQTLVDFMKLFAQRNG